MAIRHLPAQRRQLLANSAERLLDTADSPSLTMPNLDDLTPVELATLAGFVSIWKECPSLDPRTWPNQFSD